jgi:hypothetical protein
MSILEKTLPASNFDFPNKMTLYFMNSWQLTEKRKIRNNTNCRRRVSLISNNRRPGHKIAKHVMGDPRSDWHTNTT